jgi:tetratricopeptide (TPR) repeat protein
MSFDKTKAMRSAEKFLSLGKIRSAISEYQRVVENDPRDFSTLNILGDLYVKNSQKQEAIDCYTKVAEHYNRQGFAHKAIAIYNKISRLQPNSIEVSSKLAQLYQSKGSLAEARMHYISLAEQHQRKGDKTEALTIWKQIAELDPNNTDIYLKIAETCQQEDQPDDAAKAFTEAGLRLSEQGQFEEAVAAFSKALDIKKNYLRALNGMVKAQIGLGDSDEAAKILEGILEEQPYNRDILYLLVDCHLDMNNAAEAEQAIIKLVEQEPANYPKFLELVKIHLAANDLESAARILSASSEHLLVGGQADEFLSWTNEILARNPEQLNALRLLVRYYGWQRDAAELKNALERLAEAAHQNEAIDDERYALSQLVMTAPHETEYAKRLHEFNLEHGFDTGEFVDVNDVVSAEQAENFAIVEVFQESNGQPEKTNNGHNEFSFADERSLPILEDAGGNEFSGEVKEFNFYNEDFEAVVVEDETVEAEVEHSEPDNEEITGKLKLADKLKLQQEIESIEFYIEQGYKDLAENSLTSLEFEFGQQPELVELRLKLSAPVPVINAQPEPEIKKVKEEIVKEPEIKLTNVQSYESLDDLSEEFGFEESKARNENDYDTHYHTATAYREMGLTEDAIREFQNAIGFIDRTNDTRRFFQCSTLLGLCFMEKQMPNLAMMWYKRALEETKDLTGDEKQALWYELGNAYDKGGDKQKAVEYFEQIYALNVDYRDVVKRLQNLQKEAIAPAD